MSTRASLRAWLGEDIGADRIRTCAVCGGDWSGLWIGATELHVCAGCALDVLPRLIADAVWRPALDARDADALVQKVRAEFWRAMTLNALARRGRDVS